MTVNDIVQRLEGVTKTTAGWQAKCPAHDDRNASLSIAEGEGGRVLLKCHAGCDIAEIARAMGLGVKDFFLQSETSKPKLVRTYDYRNSDGELVYQVCRYEPKDFRQRRPDGSGAWLWNMRGVDRVLYRLPEVLAAVGDGRTVFVVEGEKDADSLTCLGLVATCNSGGAGKWLPAYSEALRGADVVILPDKDKPGRDHGHAVASALMGIAKTIKVVELPDRDGHKVKDAADWIHAGGTRDELESLVAGAPAWEPREEVEVTSFGHVEASPTEQPIGQKAVADIRGAIVKILLDGQLRPDQRRQAVSTAVLNCLLASGKLYSHADLNDFESAMYFDSTRCVLEKIRSDSFLAWLSDLTAVGRADSLFGHISARIETAALAGGYSTPIIPESFWSSRPGVVYLSNGPGKIVRISADDVEIVDNGTDGILFPRGRSLPAWKLTEPLDPFETCAVLRDIKSSAAHGKDLLRAWFFSLPTNPACKPPICFTGVIGSGKTRTAKAIGEIFGLPPVVQSVEQDGEEHFWPSVDSGGLLVLDNADTRVRWLPDTLAAASTDGSLQRRRLYTNSETVTMRARAWIAVTSANPSFANDAGLADRLLVVRLDRRAAGETDDAKLSAEILAFRDNSLSFVASVLQRALANKGSIPTGLNARHPDFAAMAVRIGRAIRRENEVISALRAAELDKSSFAIENDAACLALLTVINKEGFFRGTTNALLPRLVVEDQDLAQMSAKKLGRKLSSLLPHLEKVFHARKTTDSVSKAAIWEFSRREAVGQEN